MYWKNNYNNFSTMMQVIKFLSINEPKPIFKVETYSQNDKNTKYWVSFVVCINNKVLSLMHDMTLKYISYNCIRDVTVWGIFM